MPFTFKPPEGQAQAVDIFSREAITTKMKESGGSIILFSSVIILILSLVVAGGLYAYQRKLFADVTEQKTQLASYDSKLGVLPIDEMRLVSTRIKFASQLVKEHTSTDSAFRILEESIENPVTYTKFELQSNNLTGKYDLTLGGKAPDYRSVIQQQETLRNKPYTTYLSDAVISDVNANDKGFVTFSVKSPIAIKGILPEAFIVQNQEASTSVKTVAP
jgi:hypothetical protein